MPLARVLRRIRSVREDRYTLLRGYFHGADDQETETIEADHLRLHAVTVMAGASAVGQPLSALARKTPQQTEGGATDAVK